MKEILKSAKMKRHLVLERIINNDTKAMRYVSVLYSLSFQNHACFITRVATAAQTS